MRDDFTGPDRDGINKWGQRVCFFKIRGNCVPGEPRFPVSEK
jgi:hypothetical protein